jgi:hypothetical protein
MDLNQVCVAKQTQDFRPESQKDRFKLGPANVTQANPDDFGWRSLKHDPIKEIGVPGENRPVMQAGMFPYLPV